MICHSILLDEARSTKLKARAADSGLKQSEIVRQALDLYFKTVAKPRPTGRRLAAGEEPS